MTNFFNPNPYQKSTIDLLFKNNRIRVGTCELKEIRDKLQDPPPCTPFRVDVINVWFLAVNNASVTASKLF